MKEISQEEFNNWLNSPVTEALFETLSNEADTLAHGISQGAYANDPNERMFMGYVRAMRETVNPDNLREAIVSGGDEE